MDWTSYSVHDDDSSDESSPVDEDEAPLASSLSSNASARLLWVVEAKRRRRRFALTPLVYWLHLPLFRSHSVLLSSLPDSSESLHSNLSGRVP